MARPMRAGARLGEGSHAGRGDLEIIDHSGSRRACRDFAAAVRVAFYPSSEPPAASPPAPPPAPASSLPSRPSRIFLRTSWAADLISCIFLRTRVPAALL